MTQTVPAISEKPIQNEWRLKICAQSGSGERKLTQTDPIKKKMTQTVPAISEKPIQNEWRLKICAQSGSGEKKLTQADPIKKKMTQTVPAISEKPENLLGVVQICSHSGATYHICRMVAETISVKYTRHGYQHSAPDIALMLCTCL